MGGSVLLTMGMWYPAWLYSSETARSQIPLSEAVAGSLGWHEILHTFFGGLTQPAISRCDPWEGTCYIGVTALWMIPFGWAQAPRRLRYGLLLAVIFAIFCSLGRSGGVFEWFYYTVPGWSFLNLPNRSLLIPAIALPIFAAFGFQRWLNGERFPAWIHILLSLTFSICFIFTLYSIGANSWVPTTLVYSALTQTFHPNSISDAHWSIINFCAWTSLTLIVLILYSWKIIQRKALICILLLLLVTQSAQYTQRLFLETTSADFFNPPHTIDFRERAGAQSIFYRVCGYAPFIDAGSDVRLRFNPPILTHRLAEVFRLHEIQGYDPMYPHRYADLLRAWAGHSHATDPTRTLRLERLPKRLLDFLSVRYVIGYPNQENIFRGRGELESAGVLQSPVKPPKMVESIMFRWLLTGVPHLPQAAEIGRVGLHHATETIQLFPVRLGINIANYITESPSYRARHRPATEYRWFPIPLGAGYSKVRQYIAEYKLDKPHVIDSVSIESYLQQGLWAILEIDALTPDRKGLVLLSDKAELPVYENPNAYQSAYLSRNVLRYEHPNEIAQIIDQTQPGDPLPVFFHKQDTISMEIPPVPVKDERKSSLSYHRNGSDQMTITLKTPREAYLAITENYSPNWKARIDGKSVSIHRANHAFMALPVPAGEHTVVLYYFPQSFYVGCAIGGSALIVVLVILFRKHRRWLTPKPIKKRIVQTQITESIPDYPIPNS